MVMMMVMMMGFLAIIVCLGISADGCHGDGVCMGHIFSLSLSLSHSLSLSLTLSHSLSRSFFLSLSVSLLGLMG